MVIDILIVVEILVKVVLNKRLELFKLYECGIII